jgi:hypothetical protein
VVTLQAAKIIVSPNAPRSSLPASQFNEYQFRTGCRLPTIDDRQRSVPPAIADGALERCLLKNKSNDTAQRHALHVNNWFRSKRKSYPAKSAGQHVPIAFTP